MRGAMAAGPDHALERSVAQALKTYGHQRLELEFRLGQRGAGGFVPGVTQAAWEALKAALDESCGEGRAFRLVTSDTRELIAGDGTGAKYVMDSAGGAAPFWMHKKRLWDLDRDTGTPWCCRASASLEVVDAPRREDAPRRPPASHRFERHKQRWSYRHRCWSLDLTRVASNLPHQLDNDDVSYEVELELVDTSELFARTLPNLLEWAHTMVADVCAMMA